MQSCHVCVYLLVSRYYAVFKVLAGYTSSSLAVSSKIAEAISPIQSIIAFSQYLQSPLLSVTIDLTVYPLTTVFCSSAVFVPLESNQS